MLDNVAVTRPGVAAIAPPLTTNGGHALAVLLAYLRTNPLVVAAIVVIMLVVAAAAAAPWLAPHDPYAMTPIDRLKPPGAPGYLFGTDSFGRDLRSRVMWGGRISLIAGVVPALVTMVIGVGVGLLTGY